MIDAQGIRAGLDIASAIIAYEQGDLDEEATIALFQYLVDTGLAWSLQGSYGRAAHAMILDGTINPPANRPSKRTAR